MTTSSYTYSDVLTSTVAVTVIEDEVEFEDVQII